MSKHHTKATKKHHKSASHTHAHHSTVTEPTSQPPKKTSSTKGRAIILVVVLIVLLLILFFVWNIFQTQQQASYSITGDDLSRKNIIQRLFSGSENSSSTQTNNASSNSTTSNNLESLINQPPAQGGPNLGPNEIAQGEQRYKLSTSGRGPALNSLIINEFDPAIGTQQAIRVEAQFNQPIDAITATIQTDTQTQTHNLTVTEGNNLKGVWVGEWPVTDTHSTNYTLTLTATSPNQPTSSMTLTFR